MSKKIEQEYDSLQFLENIKCLMEEVNTITKKLKQIYKVIVPGDTMENVYAKWLTAEKERKYIDKHKR